MGAYLDYLKKHYLTFILIIVFLSSFLLMIFSARTDSMVVDEKVHIPAGYLHVWKGNYLFNTEHPPLLNDLAGLFAKFGRPNVPEIPQKFNGGDQWDYGDMFFYLSGNNVSMIIFWARLPFIFLALGIIYLVYLWARALFGPKAAVLAATLTAFSPNILAHGRLATTDIGVAFAFILATWALRKYYFKQSWLNAVFFGFALSLIILTKFSGLAFLPVAFLGLIFIYLFKRPKILNSIGQLFVILIIPIILIWGTYAFSMRENLVHMPPVYQTSDMLKNTEISGYYSKWLVMPFDKYAQGLEILSDHNASGHWAYLNGQVSTSGWWYYFPLVLAYKLTLVELLLLACSIFAFCFLKKNNSERPIDWFDSFLLFFTPLVFLVVSMIGKIDIGIRHILPILPFFYVLIGSLFLAKKLILRQILVFLVVLEVILTLLAYPNYLDYFNQFAGNAQGGIKHLSDSNLDWNQNMNRFGKYARSNGINKVYELCWDDLSFKNQGIESEVIPNQPVSGVVVLCAQQMVVTPEGFDFSWVVKHAPDAVIGNAMYVWRFDKKNVQ